MKYLISTILFFIATQTFAYDYTLKSRDHYCKVKSKTEEAISFEKENKNIIKIAARKNAKCEINKSAPLLIYWILGEPEFLHKGKPVCDRLNFFERMFIKVKKKHVQIIDNKSFYWTSKLLIGQFNKFPDAPPMSKKVRIELVGNTLGNCEAKAYIKINGKEQPIDKVFVVRSGMSLKELEAFDEGSSFLNLKK